ncbi:hypothetical protein ACROYT_G024855 [Oculina patagonica]
MNKLFLLALVGFVLAIGLALPFNEDGDNLSNDLNSEDAERNLDWDPEDDVDENEDEDYEYDDDDDDDDDDDQEDEDDDNALSNPLKKSSDPFIRHPDVAKVAKLVDRKSRCAQQEENWKCRNLLILNN